MVIDKVITVAFDVREEAEQLKKFKTAHDDYKQERDLKYARVVEMVKREACYIGSDGKALEAALGVIDVDAVHCKDCKHWLPIEPTDSEGVRYCEYAKWLVGANGYCVYGERK